MPMRNRHACSRQLDRDATLRWREFTEIGRYRETRADPQTPFKRRPSFDQGFHARRIKP